MKSSCLLCKDILKLSFSRLFKQDKEESSIFKLVKNFEALGTSKNHRAMVSLLSGPSITQEECVYVINNFACHIQQCLKLNSEHL